MASNTTSHASLLELPTELLDQITGVVASFTGDGGYDQDRVYDSVAQRHPTAAVIVAPRATAVPGAIRLA